MQTPFSVLRSVPDHSKTDTDMTRKDLNTNFHDSETHRVLMAREAKAKARRATAADKRRQARLEIARKSLEISTDEFNRRAGF